MTKSSKHPGNRNRSLDAKLTAERIRIRAANVVPECQLMGVAVVLLKAIAPKAADSAPITAVAFHAQRNIRREEIMKNTTQAAQMLSSRTKSAPVTFPRNTADGK